MFYDTETTGLPLYREPSDDPRQPHIVQLAAAVVNLDTQQLISSMDVIVRPDGWSIPQEIARIHGISTEYALDVGIPEEVALRLLTEFWSNTSVRIAHNETFDARMIRIGLKRYDVGVDPDAWKAGNAVCTQRLATPLCKLGKTASLSEAFQHFTGANRAIEHDAMSDVQACVAVYFAIMGGSHSDAAAGQQQLADHVTAVREVARQGTDEVAARIDRGVVSGLGIIR